MISWIIITVLLLIFLEVVKRLDKKYLNDEEILKHKENIKILKRKSNRTLEDQASFLKSKLFLKNILGSWTLRMVLTIIMFVLFINLLDYSWFDSTLAVCLLIIFYAAFSSKLIAEMVNTKYKTYLDLYEFSLFIFFLSFIVIEQRIGFYIGDWNVHLLFMLPYFFVVKIIYYNVREKIWSQC